MPVPQLPSTQTRPVSGTDYASLMTPTSFETVGGASYLPIRPNEPFFLRHHPGNWRISVHLEKPTALPELTMHVLAPGVNGVRTRDKGEDAEMGYKKSVRDSEDRGWTYLDPGAPIPPDCLPPGVQAGGYLRDLDCKDPVTGVVGKRFVETWNLPIATLPDALQQFKFQMPAYERWLAYLVASGQIKPMLQSVLTAMTDRVRGHLERAQTIPYQPDVRAIFVERKQIILDAYAAAQHVKVERAQPATVADVSEQTIADAVSVALAEKQRENEERFATMAAQLAAAEAKAAEVVTAPKGKGKSE